MEKREYNKDMLFQEEDERHRTGKLKPLVIIVSLFFLSCSSPIHYYLRDGEEISRIKKVAILPFKNITVRRNAGRIITNLFATELFNSGLCQIVEIGNIREFFIQQRIRKKAEVDLDTIKILGIQFGLDAVILGVVEEYYQEGGGMRETNPRVSLSAQILDTKTGKILWKCHHRKTGDDYIILLDWGKVRTVTLLAQKVIQEMIATIKGKV